MYENFLASTRELHRYRQVAVAEAETEIAREQRGETMHARLFLGAERSLINLNSRAR